MKHTVVALLASFAALSASAQERAEFKGVPLGATRTEFLEKNPLFRCESKRGYCSLDGLNAPQHCTLKRYEGGKRGEDFSEQDCILAVVKSGTYANKQANLTATFRGETLSEGYVGIPPDSFDSIAEAITARYGPPASSSNETVQNRAGAKFDNRTMRWTIGGDSILATKYGSTVMRGYISIVDKEAMDEMKAKDEKNRKTAPSDL